MAKLPRLRVEIYLDRESRAWIVALFRRDRAVILGGHSSEEAAADAAFEHARNYRECPVLRRDSEGSVCRLDQFKLVRFEPDRHLLLMPTIGVGSLAELEKLAVEKGFYPKRDGSIFGRRYVNAEGECLLIV